jgi:hypothetical protein
VTSGTAQSIGTSAWTALLFDTETFDVGAYHDTVTNNSRLTIPTGGSGYYSIGGEVQFAANGTGMRGIRIISNGATVVASQLVAVGTTANIGTRLEASTIYSAADAQYFELQVWQNTAVSLNSEVTSPHTPHFWLTKEGT